MGSTLNLVTFANGNVVSETRYKAWGEVRYSSAYAPTDYTYTGQYSNMGDFGLMFYNARWYDPALGRFAQADTIVPGGVQGLDRYAYTNNSPINYTDPSGHYCVGDDEGCVDEGGGTGLTPPIDPPSCSAPWPWMCSNDPPDADPEETHTREASSTSGATPAPSFWCGGRSNSLIPYCPGFLINYQQNSTPIDSFVISLNGAAAAGTSLVMFGFDVVCTLEACVLFAVGPSNLGGMPPILPHPIRAVNNASTPQFGGSLTFSPISSQIIRQDPTSEGIRDAWRGNAMQEGFSLFSYSETASSSVDANGNLTYQTTSAGRGLSVGIAEIVFEYHQYMTNAIPIWPASK